MERVLVIVLLAVAAVLAATTVSTSDGQVYNGQVVFENENFVIMNVDGSQISVPKNMITFRQDDNAVQAAPQAVEPAPAPATAPVYAPAGTPAAAPSASRKTLYLGLAMPTGDFGSDDIEEEESSYATNGFCIGFRYSKPMSGSAMAFALDLALEANPFDGSEIEDAFKEDLEVEDVTVEGGYHINIQGMPGIKFSNPISPTSKFYGIGQVVLNYYMPPEVTFSISDGSIEMEEVDTYDPAFSFGFSIAGGISFEKFDIGLRYMNMGTPKIEGEYEFTFDGESESGDLDKKKSPLSAILIYAGMNF